MIMKNILYLSLPTVAFALFWFFALKHNWRYIRLLALSVSICLWIITLILWATTSPSENWIFGVGTAFSVLVGLMLLCLPIIAPEIVSLLKFKW